MAKIITLKNVRLSWPKLWTATQYQGKGEFNYEATFLVDPKSEAAKLMSKTYKEVADEAWGAKADEMLVRFKTLTSAGDFKTTFFYNGDLKPDVEGYPGNLIVKAKRNQKMGPVLVFDRNPGTAENPNYLKEADGRPYGGCYVNGIIEVWAQTKGANLGMRCKLHKIQFVSDGDAFSGGGVTSEGFDDLSDGADAPTPGPQTASGSAGSFV